MQEDLNSNVDIKIIPFKENYQEKVYNFVWKTMLDIIKKEPNELKLELEPLTNIKDNYIDKNGGFWIAIDNETDNLLGTIGINKIDNETFKLNRFYIDERCRRQGIGSKLYKELEMFVKLNNGKYIYLNSSKHLKNAHRFYKKNNFNQINDYDDSEKYIKFYKLV